MDVNKELKFLGKYKKKKIFFGGRGVVWVGQGGCDRRIEVYRKIKNKKIFFWGGGSGWWEGGSGWIRT